jgi:hypothetical protein
MATQPAKPSTSPKQGGTTPASGKPMTGSKPASSPKK